MPNESNVVPLTDRQPVVLGAPPRLYDPDCALQRYQQLRTVMEQPELAIRVIGQWALFDYTLGQQEGRGEELSQEIRELKTVRDEFDAMVDRMINRK